MNRHVSESALALASGGDLAGWKAFWVNRHLASCSQCAERAAAYQQSSNMLRELAAEHQLAPVWLETRILTTARERQTNRGLAWAPQLALHAGLLVALAALAVLMIAWPAPIPQNQISAQAAATGESLVGEVRGPEGRERIEMYTGAREGAAEVTATGTGVAVTRTDTNTGAISITRLVMEE